MRAFPILGPIEFESARIVRDRINSLLSKDQSSSILPVCTTPTADRDRLESGSNESAAHLPPKVVGSNLPISASLALICVSQHLVRRSAASNLLQCPLSTHGGLSRLVAATAWSSDRSRPKSDIREIARASRDRLYSRMEICWYDCWYRECRVVGFSARFSLFRRKISLLRLQIFPVILFVEIVELA
jgi:hypothetical protein